MTRPAVAYIDCQALSHNYRLIQKKAYPATVIAVVKANAYGHDLKIVSQTLYDMGCRYFAVTDVEEAVRLRGLLGRQPSIVVLSGLFDLQEAELCANYHLMPFVSEEKQLYWLALSHFRSSLWLKVNSGMNRLGCQDVFGLIKSCRDLKLEVKGLCSHLSCADMSNHSLNITQIEMMQQLKKVVDLPLSLLNSAGILAMPEHVFDFVRPGIALYGASPVSDSHGLRPVMHLSSRVMQLRDVSAGSCVSYGGYQVESCLRLALVPLGYADGMPRVLSNKGYAMFEGKRLAIVGRVCMDYCLLDVTHTPLEVGSEVFFWGDNPQVNAVASLADTISYTLFTGVGSRVKRVAVQGFSKVRS